MQMRKAKRSFLFSLVCFSSWLETTETSDEVSLLTALHASVKILLSCVFRFDVLFLAGINNKISFGFGSVLVLWSFLGD